MIHYSYNSTDAQWVTFLPVYLHFKPSTSDDKQMSSCVNNGWPGVWTHLEEFLVIDVFVSIQIGLIQDGVEFLVIQPLA